MHNFQRTERQLQIQNALPLVLIPIRIDLTIHSFRPEPPLPTPNNSREFGIDETLPAYKQPEQTTDFRLRDSFLWNLHEALITPDQFARTFVDEMDFPAEKKVAMAMQVADQIRVQLQEYAGVAMHPLFTTSNQETTGAGVASDGNPIKVAQPTPLALSREQSHTPAPGASTPVPNGVAAPSFLSGLNGAPKSGTQTPAKAVTPAPQPATPAAADKVSATATAVPEDDIHNPDDTYRCIINLSINLQNRLYSDRFEWSLLHPPGFAEHFAKQTCADLGLSGEWVAAMAHAIYEAVLKLRKEACENGGIVGTAGGAVGGEIDNDAAEGKEAGWRYEPEHLGDEWEPKLEILSKEEIEKREWDRERELRRLRRDTARLSSTANIGGGGAAAAALLEVQPEEQPMGRGERSKKKRRFRSLSPLGRETPDIGAGYGGGTGMLGDWERQNFRCSWCKVFGQAVWMVRDGPHGARVSLPCFLLLFVLFCSVLFLRFCSRGPDADESQSLCQNCGYVFERDKRLPPWSRNMFELERPYGGR